MEFIIWFITILGATGGIVTFMRSAWFQNKLLPKQVKPVTAPKTLAQAHKEDHDFWLSEYKAILQKSCDHLYHHQKWYTCMVCGYQEPWVYEEGCRCTVAEDRAITDNRSTFHLIERQSFCIVHGIDFKLWPISDRKRGPYGPHGDRDDAVQRSMALTAGRSKRRIDYDIEGTN